MKNHIPSNEDLVASLSQSKHIFEGVFDITKLALNYYLSALLDW